MAAMEAVLTQVVRDAALHMTALMTEAAMMVMLRLDDRGDDDAGSPRSTTKSAINVDATVLHSKAAGDAAAAAAAACPVAAATADG